MWGLELCPPTSTSCFLPPPPPPHLLLLLPFSKSQFIFSWRAVITAAPQPHHQNELFTLGHLPLAAVASLSSPIEPSRNSHTVTKTQPSATQSPPGPSSSRLPPSHLCSAQTPQSSYQSCVRPPLSSGSSLQFGFPAQLKDSSKVLVWRDRAQSQQFHCLLFSSVFSMPEGWSRMKKHIPLCHCWV